MTKLNKIILNIGAVGAIVTPVISVVACGDNGNNEETKKLTVKDQIFIDNFKALQKKFTGGEVTMKNEKASFIAEHITSATTLKTETGIDLTSLANTSEYKISAIGTSKGVINVSVNMIVRGVSTIPFSAIGFISASGIQIASEEIELSIHHKSDFELANDPKVKAYKATKDKIQMDNLKILNDKLNDDAVKIMNDKAPIIAKHITNAATLKDETGIDLTSLANTSTYVISAIGSSTGVIVISVTMTTVGATKATTIIFHIIKQKNNTQITKDKV